MTREYYLRSLISDRGSLKDFAQSIEMPYSTLLSILKNVGGAASDNVFKICQGLGISADSLSEYDSESLLIPPFHLTEHEKQLIEKYRKIPSVQQRTIDAMIDMQYDIIKPKVKEESKTSS